uniref:C2H2-type domain-containing protein n=1 Tax=Sphaeramia orbicularis TaxID=375764 RepID=A0A672Z9J0_9TELE
MVKDEFPLEQQDRSPSLDQVDPEPPHTKEEENLWTHQEGEELQGLEEADITKFPSIPPRVKSEYGEDKAQSSQLHQSQTEETTEEPEDRDDYGESEPDSIQNNDFPICDVACKTTYHQCTEDDKTWSVEQILTAAAEEIFGVFKRSIAEIEEKLSDSPKHKKRNQRLPDTVHQTDIRIPPEQQGRSPHVDQEDPEPPHIKEEQEEEWISQEGERAMKLLLLSECPTLTQKLWMVKEELPLEQQDRSPSLDQLDPESPHIKEEENLWTNQEGEELQGLEEADITKFPSTPPRVKSECDEDKAQSSQLHKSQIEENTEEPEDGDDYGDSEPNSIQNNDFYISDVACQTAYQCTEDDKTCKFWSALDTQMTVQTTKKPFSCSVCKKGFAHKSNLKQHMSVHSREKPFSCSVCKKSFTQNSHLKQHMSVHTGEKPFSCSFCNKGFVRNSLLKEHMSVHTGEKPFSCSVCKKGFARNSLLKEHMSIHTGEKPFSCSVCKKGYTRSSEVKQHMLVHSGERPFSCSVCKKDFALKSHLKKHMLVHTGEKPFSCSVCKKGFARNSEVKRHMSVHSREKPFSCSVCKKGFSLKCNLKKHMLVHTGEKPFSCSVCKKSYTRNSEVKQHMLLHTGENPFSCSVCKKGFALQCNLKKHMFTHTRKKAYIH